MQVNSVSIVDTVAEGQFLSIAYEFVDADGLRTMDRMQANVGPDADEESIKQQARAWAKAIEAVENDKEEIMHPLQPDQTITIGEFQGRGGINAREIEYA